VTKAATRFIEKRWLSTIVLLAIMVFALCLERGLEGGLRTSAAVLFVIALMMIALSLVLSLAWHQPFFTPAVVIASLFAAGYVSFALLSGNVYSSRFLVMLGLGSGLIVGSGVALGERLRKRSDEA
jgi:hypothetical protein